MHLYVYKCTYVGTCIFMCLCIFIHMCTYICTNVCTYVISVYVRKDVNRYNCVCLYVCYVNMCTSVQTCLLCKNVYMGTSGCMIISIRGNWYFITCTLMVYIMLHFLISSFKNFGIHNRWSGFR